MIKRIIICCIFLSNLAYGMSLLLKPYDTLIIPEVYEDSCYELSFWAETGVCPAQGFNHDGGVVNIFSIYEPDQDALAMLNGFPASSTISQLAQMINATDNGIRGHVFFDGKLYLDVGAAIGARWFFVPHAWVTAYLPFYQTKLRDFRYQDLTQNNTSADARVKQFLTGPLIPLVKTLGGLELANWQRFGLGDMNLLVECLFNFPQNRSLLKNVEVGGRVGFTLPTGLRTDEDKLFAFPYGYDGATGIVFGGGLAVLLGTQFKTGFDVQLLHLFGNTRNRRIKTAIDQSDFLLLAKTPAYKDYGLIQRFNLFVQGYHILGSGFSALVGYQFLKQGECRLDLNSCDFSTTIANTAISLDEWIVHEVEFNINYDFNACNTLCVSPQLSLFARIPINGKRSVAFTTIGIMGAIDF